MASIECNSMIVVADCEGDSGLGGGGETEEHEEDEDNEVQVELGYGCHVDRQNYW